MPDRELGRAVFARIDPWIALVERRLTELLGDSPLGAVVPARDVAFAIPGDAGADLRAARVPCPGIRDDLVQRLAGGLPARPSETCYANELRRHFADVEAAERPRRCRRDR